MKLYYSPTSPYVRKVVVVAIEAGLDGLIERRPTNVQEPDAEFLAHNPLGKVPALLTEDGQVLFDSPVICEYLDSLHAGPRLFPEAEPALWQALRRQALADGILDAALLCRFERMRPEAYRWPQWIERQWAKVDRGLDALERDAPALAGHSRSSGKVATGATSRGEVARGEVTIGEVAVGVALGWLDFRFPYTPWRWNRPALAAWFETFADRPSMRSTLPQEP
jgi:glutathione S-transferase